MAATVRTDTTQEHLKRQRNIAAIKEYLKHSEDDTWQAADLIFEEAGPPSKLDPKLRDIAAEINRPELFCASLRKLAMTFPPGEARRFKVPWTCYKDVVNLGEYREEILGKIENAINGGGRRPSGQLSREMTDEVLHEHGLGPRYFRKGTASESEKLVRRIRKYLADIEAGRIEPSLDDARLVKAEMSAGVKFLTARMPRNSGGPRAAI